MSTNRITFETALFASASRSISRLLADVTADELCGPTPCCHWTGRQVVNHIVGTAHLFADSARGTSAPVPNWDQAPDILGDDPEEVYVMAAGSVSTAFGRTEVLDGVVQLAFGPMPGRAALRLVMADHVTHAWDLARCTGRSVAFDDAVVVVALQTMRTSISPDLRADGHYAPATVAPAGASTLDRLAAFTGRLV